MAGDDGGDHYRTLGISRGARKAEVKAAFCRLAQLHHPDRHHATSGSDAAASSFRAVYDAYGVLYKRRHPRRLRPPPPLLLLVGGGYKW
uniref:J domain-containing protein n=1 Tax=Oryza punctata TaxID=4537 RepID=A0A0E0JH26_ORYPU